MVNPTHETLLKLLFNHAKDAESFQNAHKLHQLVYFIKTCNVNAKVKSIDTQEQYTFCRGIDFNETVIFSNLTPTQSKEALAKNIISLWQEMTVCLM